MLLGVGDKLLKLMVSGKLLYRWILASDKFLFLTLMPSHSFYFVLLKPKYSDFCSILEGTGFICIDKSSCDKKQE